MTYTLTRDPSAGSSPYTDPNPRPRSPQNPRQNRRAQFGKNFRQLNRRSCSSGAALAETFSTMVQLTEGMAREEMLDALLDAFSTLVQATPRITGRARAGWQLATTAEGRAFKPAPTAAAIRAALRRAIPPRQVLTQAENIWVVNNVEYVLILNAGWAKQLPAGFVDRFMLTLRDLLAEASQETHKVR